eukprot:CAMPEP_0172451750 /NCGR_PEP_ID=MMETSP1065-20121228/9656_1 /TAXON_ID=265537 /ORGANISM="Amphiprora paludosa, Strain CCMP125" /LENGTH=368 /DNA_ID=CAMNT_0013203721 /DNA_START=35 /DNA_END=1141 /DNA_ORIENTATION=+
MYLLSIKRVTALLVCLVACFSIARVSLLVVPKTSDLGDDISLWIGGGDVPSIKASQNPAPRMHDEWRIQSKYWTSDGGLGPIATQNWWTSVAASSKSLRKIFRQTMHQNSKPREWYEQSKANQNLAKSFSGGLYGERNRVMNHLIQTVSKARRIFEFAGNGGFLPRQAFLSSPELDNVVEHWVHSEFSRPVLQYASFLFSNAASTIHFDPRSPPSSSDLDNWFEQRNGTSSKLPLKVRIPDSNKHNNGSSTLVEVVQIDMSDMQVLKSSINFAYFDLVATISFEHFGQDLEMISTLFQPGTWFLFGVAAFPNRQHFRYFSNEQEIRDRYSPVLDIHTIKGLVRRKETNPQKFVVLGKVRENLSQRLHE